MEAPLRVLIVDDTAVYRKIISNVLNGLPGVTVVGTAANGRIALKRIEELRPDLVTLDLEMPEMDGLEVLRCLQQTSCNVGVIMLSAFTSEDAESTITAFKLGAFDFVLKPHGPDFAENVAQLRARLAGKVTAYAYQSSIRDILRTRADSRARGPRTSPAVRLEPPPLKIPHPPQIRAVAIGISTGGPQALARMLPLLPRDLAAPVLIVQHMPPLFTRSLAEDLNRRCPMRVQEAEDHLLVQPGEILIAPGGRQMGVRWHQNHVQVQLTDDPPENSCRPSVDYLFRSVAEVFGGQALAVIMTGMGNDGNRGCRLLKERGAVIVAQDAETCTVFGMPQKPIEEGLANVVAPLDHIAATITQYVEKGVLACR
ncbi:MAG: chemotaxis response regulator protein-glutamate methylesterase [Pirellulales bacterium]|nr:chemotaxis response regulator protein-glutamate methylesterase [Pirellulales bacterium]